MAGKRGVVLERLQRGIDRPARFVSEHHDQWCTEDRDGVFEAGDHVVVGEIARHPADEEIASGAVKSIFGSYTRISAAENRCVGVLAVGEGLALVNEIVSPGNAGNVAG